LGHLLLQNDIPFSMAHCNFQLRDDESSRDEQFVRTLAAAWQVPLYVKHFDTKKYADEHACSIQVAARELRYTWFYALLVSEMKNGLLATAHHANDSVETMLMNLMRGTGIEGLHGILPKKDKLIRPLLFATKQEILEYALANNLAWVEDSSNESSKYTRNFIRNEMIPAAEKIFPAAVKNMLGTIEKMQEAEQLYMQAIAQHKKKLLIPVKEEWQIPVLLLQKTQPIKTITWELIKPFGFSEGQMGEVLKLCHAETGSYVQAMDWRIIRHRKWLLIAPSQTAQASHFLIEGDDCETNFPAGKLNWKTNAAFDLQMIKQLSVNEAVLDAKHLPFPLILRPWKVGDYFYPLGMRKKKKVARLLIDLKLSKTAKEKIWVLESNNRIVWVVGLRIDDRFKVTPATTAVLQLQFVSHRG
jgi:tRNA(Ile)-lysidine synthase